MRCLNHYGYKVGGHRRIAGDQSVNFKGVFASISWWALIWEVLGPRVTNSNLRRRYDLYVARYFLSGTDRKPFHGDRTVAKYAFDSHQTRIPTPSPIASPNRTARPGTHAGLNCSGAAGDLGNSSTTVEPSKNRPISSPFFRLTWPAG